MVPRSTASMINARARPTGKRRQNFGATDHSFTASNGMEIIPVVTCTPWVSR
jgi:hypothetical protein